jgi:hypothetical protein
MWVFYSMARFGEGTRPGFFFGLSGSKSAGSADMGTTAAMSLPCFVITVGSLAKQARFTISAKSRLAVLALIRFTIHDCTLCAKNTYCR